MLEQVYKELEDLEERFLSKHTQYRGRDVLEIGCGSGSVTGLLAKETRSLVGIDTELESLAEARSETNGAKFICDSGQELPFPDQSFDSVFFSYSLHHHPEPYKALQEAHRVLRDDGQLVILEPTPKGNLHEIYSIFDDETERFSNALNSVREIPFLITGFHPFFFNPQIKDMGELILFLTEEYQRTPTNKILIR